MTTSEMRSYRFFGGPLNGAVIDTDHAAEWRDVEGRCNKSGADPATARAYRFDERTSTYVYELGEM